MVATSTCVELNARLVRNSNSRAMGTSFEEPQQESDDHSLTDLWRKIAGSAVQLSDSSWGISLRIASARFQVAPVLEWRRNPIIVGHKSHARFAGGGRSRLL